MGRQRARLTDKFIRALKPPSTGSRIHHDAEVPGFGARITSNGVIAFTLDFRLQGRNRRGTLARWPEYSATAARNKAIEYRKRISEGVDPFEVVFPATLGELARDYLTLHANVKKAAISAKKDQQIIDALILPTLKGATPLENVTTRKLEELHISLKDTPYQANRVLSLLSKMFSLAVRWKLVSTNPCKGIDKFSEQPRERYLSKDELKRLVSVLDVFPDRGIASALALMMLTGCRKTEALTAEWTMFDLNAGVWTKPSHHTKQKRVHRIPLNKAAVRLVSGLPRSPIYLFPGRVEGQPLQDIKKAWEVIRTAAQVPNLRMHDLRHSYASMLASNNLSLPIIGQLLGHTQAQTTQRYAHLLDETLRDATAHVGLLIDRARK